MFLGRFVCQKCGRRFATLRLGQGRDITGINSAAGSHGHGPNVPIEEATSRYHEMEAEHRRLGIKSNAELNAESRAELRAAKKAERTGAGVIGPPNPWAHRSGVDGFDVVRFMTMRGWWEPEAVRRVEGWSRPHFKCGQFLTVQLSGPGEPGPAFYERPMPTEYRVIDLSSPTIDPDEHVVQSTSPERAVMEALGIEVVRSGPKHDLRARVYFQHPGQPVSMVRLYSKVGKTLI